MFKFINRNYNISVNLTFDHLLPVKVQTQKYITCRKILQKNKLRFCPNNSYQRRYFTQSSLDPNQIPENLRMWEPVPGTPLTFKVVSYNVLAQCLLEAHPHLYTACSPDALQWEYRWNLIYNEIVYLDPDILCLQEVQIDHLESFYNKFEQLGYASVFKCKTGPKRDGCAIYFKKSMFTLQDHWNVEFNQHGLADILNRDNIGIIVKLAAHREPNKPILVATTHLLYNPKREDVRLAQMQLFLAEIDRVSYSKYDEKSAVGPWPVILTGDFNSQPHSPLTNLLLRGHAKVNGYNPNFKNIGLTDSCQHFSVKYDRETYSQYVTSRNNVQIQSTEYKANESTNQSHQLPSSHKRGSTITHKLNLKSAYDLYCTKYGGLQATTFQNGWVYVDYICYSHKSALKLREILQLPIVKQCKALKSLPNHLFGSDHLAVGAIFELKFEEPQKIYLFDKRDNVK